MVCWCFGPRDNQVCYEPGRDKSAPWWWYVRPLDNHWKYIKLAHNPPSKNWKLFWFHNFEWRKQELIVVLFKKTTSTQGFSELQSWNRERTRLLWKFWNCMQ
jgi:hypothetical protein